MNNTIMLTDSYKCTHYKQYPKDTQRVYAYFESRNGAKWDETVFFGLQYILKEHLTGVRVTMDMVDEAEHLINAHLGGGFNRAGWEHIVRKHGGHLPVEIKAVAEGSVVPVSNVLMTVENTDEECGWLTNDIETILTHVWYPCTVATQSHEMRKIISRYLATTGDDAPDFKVHDFGFRGVSCVEQAGLGGAAHLLSFSGTDTLQAIMMLRKYYGADMPGFSIPASEHSTITSWGREHEVDAFRNMLEQYPTGMVACVSDSFNIWEACSDLWGTQLRDMVLNRDGVLVIRPDSGTPGVVLPKILSILWDRFGGTTNTKGYKVLDPHVRVIQGDGIDIESLPHILSVLEQQGWSADNLAFGSGGGLLQKLNRDTQRFAFKCSAIQRANEWHDVWKDPITDSGKTSKRGRLMLEKQFGHYETLRYSGRSCYSNELISVFRNGELLVDYKFDDIKGRLNAN